MKIMNSKYVIAIFGVLFFSCQSIIPGQKVQSYLENRDRAGDTIIYLNFKQVLGMEGDYIEVLGPYISIKEINEDSGINHNCIAETGIEYSDRNNVLCLIRNDSVIYYEPISFKYDFSFVKRITILNYNEKEIIFNKVGSRYVVDPISKRNVSKDGI